MEIGSTLPFVTILSNGIVIKGANHPDAEHGVGITRDVNADDYHAWVKANPDFAPTRSGHIFVLAE